MRRANHQHGDGRSDEAARLAESRAILRRVREETAPQTGAGFAGLANRLGRHVDGGEADPADRVEIWGTRIGRAASLLVFAGCCAFLVWQFAA